MKNLTVILPKTNLYCHYKGDAEPCWAYISLDLETGIVDTDYQAENGVSMRVWNNLEIHFPVSPLSSKKFLKKLLSDSTFQNLMMEFLNNSSIDDDDIGHYNNDLYDSIVCYIEQIYDPEFDALWIIDEEYFYSDLEYLSITKDTSDDDLIDIANRLEDSIDSPSGEYEIRFDIYDFVLKRRDYLRESED